jgi:hypothetical protein
MSLIGDAPCQESGFLGEDTGGEWEEILFGPAYFVHGLEFAAYRWSASASMEIWNMRIKRGKDAVMRISRYW